MERLFSTIDGLRARGVGIVHISHRMDEIEQIADRATVLRNGRVAGTVVPGEANRDEVIALMVGSRAKALFGTDPEHADADTATTDDSMIISPNEAKPLTAVVKKAYDAGIPVIVLDRKVEGDAYTAYIGGDNEAIGKKASEYYANTMLPEGGKVVEISGLAGSTPAAERAAGFREGIKANPKVEIVGSQSAEWLREKGQTAMDALLKSNPDIDAVYSYNDPMAEGAYLAAKSAGKEGDLKFTGIDALPIASGGIKAVEAGRLNATFVYPTGGREAVAMAKQLLVDCKTDVPKSTTLETEQVTADNAKEVYGKLGGTE